MGCRCGAEPAHKTPQACAGAKVLARLTTEQRRVGGQRGGKTRATAWRQDLERRIAEVEAAIEDMRRHGWR